MIEKIDKEVRSASTSRIVQEIDPALGLGARRSADNQLYASLLKKAETRGRGEFTIQEWLEIERGKRG